MRLIDADELDNKLSKKIIPSTPEYNRGIIDAGYVIAEMPTIDAEIVKHGKWIGTEDDGCGDDYPVFTTFMCSECKREFLGDLSFDLHYCPNCGAKMAVREACEKQQ